MFICILNHRVFLLCCDITGGRDSHLSVKRALVSQVTVSHRPPLLCSLHPSSSSSSSSPCFVLWVVHTSADKDQKQRGGGHLTLFCPQTRRKRSSRPPFICLSLSVGAECLSPALTCLHGAAGKKLKPDCNPAPLNVTVKTETWILTSLTSLTPNIQKTLQNKSWVSFPDSFQSKSVGLIMLQRLWTLLIFLLILYWSSFLLFLRAPPPCDDGPQTVFISADNILPAVWPQICPPFILCLSTWELHLLLLHVSIFLYCPVVTTNCWNLFSYADVCFHEHSDAVPLRMRRQCSSFPPCLGKGAGVTVSAGGQKLPESESMAAEESPVFCVDSVCQTGRETFT